MNQRHWTRLLLAATTCAVFAAPVAAQNANGFDRFGIQIGIQGRRDDRGPGPRSRGGYQEQAFARGYSDGWRKGLDDGRDRDRYDPARQRDYRDGDQGYSRSYGSRDAYKNNYRSGFRQGYEDGYRDGARGGSRDGGRRR